MLNVDEVSQTLRKQAHFTNDLIGQGYSSRLGVLEETITDINLLAIAKEHEEYIYTRKFTKREEGARSGADWLWCIGEPGSWLLLLVQAKIINPSTGKCHHLDYRNGQQRTLLLNYARKLSAVPIYAIYSHIPNGYEPAAKARPIFSKLLNSDWGVSWISPKRVRQLAKEKQQRLEHVLSYSTPWHCVLSDKEELGKLGHVVASALAKCQNELRDQNLTPALRKEEVLTPTTERKKPRVQWESVDPTTLVSEDLPNQVKRILRNEFGAKTPIAGVSVISGVPLKDTDELRRLPNLRSEELYVPSSFATKLRIKR